MSAPSSSASLFPSIDTFEPAQAGRHAVVLVDDVPQADTLAGHWAALGYAVHIVSHGAAALDEAAAWLATQAATEGRFDSVHVVGHGSAGRLQLGQQLLNHETVAEHQASLASLGRSVAAGGDILWYGCDAAGGLAGAALLAELAAATGRDSAGSTNRTGSRELGGDWLLERNVGRIEAQVLTWGGSGVLLSTTADFNDQGSDAVWSNQNYQGLVWDGFDVYASGSSGVGGSTELIFASSNQVASIAISSGVFTPVSIAAYIWMGGDATVTFRGYVGASLVATADYTLPNSGGNNPNTLYTFGAGFANITRLEIDPTTNGNNAGGFDNFVFDLDTTPPTVSSVNSSKTDGSYGVGEVIAITVNFSENVVVTGTPTLALNSGGSASYASGSGSSALVFNYTVGAGHSSADLDYSATNALALAGGTIKDSSGNNGTLTLPTPGAANSLGANKALVIDGSAPSVSSVGVPSNATYIIGQNLDFTVNFDQAVTVNTGGGTPYIALTLDTGGSVQAAYVSGSGGTALVFRYTVASGNLDANGVALAASITANGGTLRNAASNNASLTLNSVGSTTGVLVDGVVPSVSSINRVSSALTNGTTVDYTVSFAEAVSGVDTSDFSLTTTGTASGAIASVSAVSGSSYTVTVNTLSGNGTLRLDLKSSGTGITDSAGNAVNAGYTSGQTYTLDQSAPAVSSVSVPSNATYIAGQNLDFTVNFDQAVTVNTGGGTPYIGLTLDTGGSVQAAYVSGSGGTALVFRYTVASGNLDGNGVALAGSITANGGTLRDAATNNATLTLNSVGSTAGVLVDAVVPTVNSVSVPANASYGTGQALNFTVNFSEAVTVNTGGGTPYIALTLDTGGTAYANYVSGSGTSAIVFRYTVASGTLDSTGVAVAGAIQANGATLQDGTGNNATLTLNSVGSTGSVLVDGVAPSVSSINRVSASVTNGTTVDYTVSFAEAVSGVDSSDFSLTKTGTADGVVASVSAVNSSTYTVTVNTLSGNGTLRLDLKSSGTGITDTATNPIPAGYTSGQTYTLDQTGPSVSSVGVPSNATYIAGQNLDFTVNFDEAVTVNTGGGTPRLALTLNTGGTVYASYLSGSGSTALTFRHTVGAGTADNDGVVVGALSANGGTLRDAAGNDATLTLNSVGSTASVLVDAIAPTISSVNAPANGTYAAGQALNFSVNFSENVVVNTGGGTPYITLTLDTGGSVQAAYISGSGTSTLVFRYTAASGNLDANGVALAGSITANGGTLRDSIGNDATLTLNSVASTASVLVDAVAPTVSGIVRAGSNPTNAGSTTFTVSFAEAVSGVSSGDFSLTSTGTAAGSVASVSAVNASTYTVTVNSLSGDGTLRLDLNSSGTGITDTPGNAIATGYTSGQTTTLDHTAPTVSTVAVPANAVYGAGQALDFTVNFNETITVATGGGTPRLALQLDTGGTVYASYLSGSGSSALVFRTTVLAGQGDVNGVGVGTLSANGGSLRDAAGNDATLTLNNVAPTTGVLVDTVSPAVTGVAVPASGQYRVGDVLSFAVSFNEAITVNTSAGSPQLLLAFDGPYSGQATYVGGSGTSTLQFQYLVKAGDLDANGIVVSSLQAQGATLRDISGNDAALALVNVGATTGVRLDTLAPVVSAIQRDGPASTGASSASFQVQFSEVVTGVDLADFGLATTGSASGSLTGLSSSDGKLYTVQVGSLSGDGLLRLDLKNVGTGIADTTGNALASGYSSGQTLTLDHQAPQVSAVGAPAAGLYRAGSVLEFQVQFSEAVTVDTTGGQPRLQLSLQSGAAQAVYAGGSGSSTLLFRYTVAAGDADRFGPSVLGLAPGGASLRDGAGNDASLVLNNVASTAAVVIDAALPATAVLQLPAAGLYGLGDALDFVLQFSAVAQVSGLPSITLSLDNGQTVQAVYAAGSGSSALSFRYVVAAGDSASAGLVAAETLNLSGGTLRDSSGRDLPTTLSGAGSAPQLRVDGVAPLLQSITHEGGGATAEATLVYTLRFNEDISGLDTSDFSLSSTGNASARLAGVSAVDGRTWRVTVENASGEGSLLLALSGAGSGVVDAAGNALAAQRFEADPVVLDHLAPKPLSLGAAANGQYQPGDTIEFRLGFGEAVVVDSSGGTPALQLQLASGSVLASYVSGSGGSTLVFRHTVGAMDDDADGLAIDLLSLQGGTITDLAGNSASLALPTLPDTQGLRVGDGDGVAAGIEDLVPTPGQPGASGDGNADGTPDRAQGHVASGPVNLPGQVNGASATLVADALAGSGREDQADGNSATLRAVTVQPAPGGLGPEIVVPFGLFSFTAVLGQAGIRETFSAFVGGSQGVNGFWLFDTLLGWVPGQMGGEAVGGQRRFDFALTDGGTGDLDGQVNGEIVVLGGAAFVPLALSGVAPPDMSDGFGA